MHNKGGDRRVPAPQPDPVLHRPDRRPGGLLPGHPGAAGHRAGGVRHLPLIEQCLAGALALGTSDGVWGGVLLERGAVVVAKRRPGRPRKVANVPSGAAA